MRWADVVSLGITSATRLFDYWLLIKHCLIGLLIVELLMMFDLGWSSCWYKILDEIRKWMRENKCYQERKKK